MPPIRDDALVNENSRVIDQRVLIARNGVMLKQKAVERSTPPIASFSVTSVDSHSTLQCHCIAIGKLWMFSFFCGFVCGESTLHNSGQQSEVVHNSSHSLDC